MPCRPRRPGTGDRRAPARRTRRGGILAACGGSSGASDSEGVSVTEAWARATPPSTTTGAVYFDVAADDGDLLIGASVPAGHRRVHRAAHVDGRRVEWRRHDARDGTARRSTWRRVAFEPGANHVMLTDLVEPLVAGDSFELTLEFESAGSQVVTVDVRDE